MNPKLVRLLLCHRHQGGFAIALTLAMGLVMILVGISLIINSTQKRGHAETTQATAEGISLAEVGGSRIQNLLNDNRYLALYNDCVNRATVPEPGSETDTPKLVCKDSGTTISWTNIPEDLKTKLLACQTGEATGLDDIAHNLDWITIPQKGLYRLVSYKYLPNDPSKPNQAPGRGILTLEGRSRENNKIRVATTRLQVAIPVKESPPETVGIPGLWTTTGGLENNRVQGDVLLNDCGVTNLDGLNASNIVDAGGVDYSAKHTAMQFPDLPGIPANEGTPPTPGTVRTEKTAPYLGNLDATDFDSAYLNANNPKIWNFPRKDSSGNIKDVPRSVNITDKDGNVTSTIQVYEYVIDDIDFPTSNHQVVIQPGKRVTFYLRGNIIKGGGFVHSCVSGGVAIADCKPTNFQIFGYGTTALASGETSHKICVSGSDKVETFIFAPTYRVGASGSGGDGGFKGSIWANTWATDPNCGSNTNNIVVEQTARWEDLTGLTPKNVPPTIGSINDWQRLER